MALEQWKNLAAAIQSIATALSFIVAGYWVYLRYIRQQENFPNIEFSADVNLIGEQGNWYIVELIGIVENKGKVQHKMEEFEFDLNAINSQDAIDVSDDWGGQVNFPNLVVKGSFLPRRFKFFFIDPGIRAKYSYVARVNKDATFLIFHCWFKYVDGRHLGHTAEKTISIMRLKDQASRNQLALEPESGKVPGVTRVASQECGDEHTAPK